MIDHTHKNLIRSWMMISFSIFFIGGILGLLMRYMGIGTVPLDYKYILHAHSHTALLGFGFIFIIGAFIFLLFPKTTYSRTYYKLLLIHLIITIGMALSFLYQGYGPISITFSTIMLLISYFISYYVLRDYKKIKTTQPNRMIPLSIYWYLLSTVPLWIMGPVMVFLGRDHPLYFLTIQSFLHLQFNGWFTFAILGLLMFFVRQNGIPFRLPVKGLSILILSLFLTFFLNVSAAIPKPVFFYLNSAGVILQLIAFHIILTPLIHQMKKIPAPKNLLWVEWVLRTGITCLVLKVLLQTTVAIPEIAKVSYTIRNYIVGFIHLIMLGSVFLTAAGILLRSHILPLNNVSKKGWILFTAVFIGSEFVLFAQATLVWIPGGYFPYYNQTIFWISILFPISIGMILAGIYYAIIPKNRESALSPPFRRGRQNK